MADVYDRVAPSVVNIFDLTMRVQQVRWRVLGECKLACVQPSASRALQAVLAARAPRQCAAEIPAAPRPAPALLPGGRSLCD